MTVSLEGEIQWATPQTHALLAKARVDETWRTQHLAPQLKSWLQNKPQVGHQYSFTELDYPLAVKFINEQAPDGNEKLLKLIDGEQPTGAQLLKVKLEITERESEVLYWIANGKTNREAAEILEMSPRTVNKHLEQLFPKLGVENRTAAAGVALRILAVD